MTARLTRCLIVLSQTQREQTSSLYGMFLKGWILAGTRGTVNIRNTINHDNRSKINVGSNSGSISGNSISVPAPAVSQPSDGAAAFHASSPNARGFVGGTGVPHSINSTVFEDFVAQQLQLLSRGTNHIASAAASPNAMFASFPGYPAAFNVDPMSPFFHKTAFTTARGKSTSSPAKALPDKTSPCKDSPSKRAQDAGGTHAMASALSVNMQTLQQKYKKIQNKLKAVQNEAKEILQLKVVVIKSHEDTIKNLQSKIRDLELALASLQTRLNPI